MNYCTVILLGIDKLIIIFLKNCVIKITLFFHRYDKIVIYNDNLWVIFINFVLK